MMCTGNSISRRLVVAFGLFSMVCFAAPIFTVTLDSTQLNGSRNSGLIFTGIIANGSGVELFLNGAVGSVSPADLTLDFTPFFTSTPLSLQDGASYAGDIFAVAINGIALPGDYFGIFTILGGADSSTFDDVGSVDFGITVEDSTAVPEPSSFSMVVMASLVFGVGFFSRRHRWRLMPERSELLR